MKNEKITVDLGGNRIVKTKAGTKYTGTETGSYCRNSETYDVTCHGIACEGTWDGDARNPVHVSRPPSTLKRILLPIWRSQEEAENRRALARMSRADRAYFSSLELVTA